MLSNLAIVAAVAIVAIIAFRFENISFHINIRRMWNMRLNLRYINYSGFLSVSMNILEAISNFYIYCTQYTVKMYTKVIFRNEEIQLEMRFG